MPIVIPMKKYQTWSPENPKLYEVEYILTDKSGKELDHIYSYLGMRKVHTDGNFIIYHRIENDKSGKVLAKSAMHVTDNVERFKRENVSPHGEVCYCITQDDYINSSERNNQNG